MDPQGRIEPVAQAAEIPTLCLTIAEAAKVLRVSTRKIRELIAVGAIPAKVLPGIGRRRHLRIFPDELAAWLSRLPAAVAAPAPRLLDRREASA